MGRENNGVESLDMPDLEGDPRLLCKLAENLPFFSGRCHGLLDEDGDAGFDKAGGDFGVCGRGSHDAGRMNAGQQLRGQFGKIWDSKLLSDFPGLIWRTVKDALENYAIKLGVNTSMVFPQVPDSGYENPDGFVVSRSSG